MKAIEFENVGKMYRLGRVGTGTLSHDLNRWWQTSILGKEDPYLRIGETNDRTVRGTSDYVWALRDISFSVEEGEVVGIIGKNGAGKSTLLKLLSNITAPTTGEIRYRGRIASLLEVGTGFHQEMTGRENIYMNGSIMGMTRAEITSKLDDIVDFAGVSRYLDTPVKRYSVGMSVRLGFAVAAFLEPEILVVDEVLTVGDAEFQKKAIGKMDDVAHQSGRTILFVSHNMASIKQLCKKGILLENGLLKFEGGIKETVDEYMTNSLKVSENVFYEDLEKAPGNEKMRVQSFVLLPLSGNELSVASGIHAQLKFKNFVPDIMLDVTIELFNAENVLVFTLFKQLTRDDSKVGFYTLEFDVPPYTLNRGKYSFRICFGLNNRARLYWGPLEHTFELEDVFDVDFSDCGRPGLLKPDYPINCCFEGK
ncbi:MAG: ABC transporter ATP-binding protein [Bacteroidales bacterium]|nr:ABC transporter ATP-binding protein [Bacteroidales bacterium]